MIVICVHRNGGSSPSVETGTAVPSTNKLFLFTVRPMTAPAKFTV
jgi:hypothetical protein